ncbi:hypothetical protein ACQEU8_02295 [Streptomyces sp. CA-250714]|uniref:hypothetical protein n=1 Tax=Streptomyces sp. CA-250714 TaxID=3240060 RepID=UPI003D9187FF
MGLDLAQGWASLKRVKVVVRATLNRRGHAMTCPSCNSSNVTSVGGGTWACNDCGNRFYRG